MDLHDINLNDVDKMVKLLQINRRMDFVIEKMNFYGHEGLKRKTAGFCANQEQAAFMAAEFNERGIKSVALTANNSIEERKQYVARLEFVYFRET